MHMTKAVYGSLRVGQYNWEHSFKHARLIHASDKVKGFTMRTNGGFPAAFRTDDLSKEIEVDVFDLSSLDPSITQAVDRMEDGAGYDLITVVTEAGYEVGMYVMKDDSAYRFPTPVPSGNWLDYTGVY
jgi:gamma-glutamylcyclotransferase (GGCT)/AIG2-like uncharacterized protein YtfP